MVIVPIVVMNAGMFKNDISTPFTTPVSRPTSRPTSTATAIGRLKSFMQLAHIMPAKDIIDPTERSMPPVIITNVIPMAISDIIDICLVMLSRLSTVMNISVENANITIITISAITTPNSRLPVIFLNMFLFIFLVPHCVQQHFFLFRFLPVHNSHDAARGNDSYPVAHLQYLVHIR